MKPTELQDPQYGPRRRVTVAVSFTLITFVFAIWVVRRPASEDPSAILAVSTEVSRTNLVLRDQRLHLAGQVAPFTGWMLERNPDGKLRSRSSVSSGVLHGVSQGWHTNGQLQVEEHFREGVSHGLRTKWYPSGAKLSEATIADGRLNGPFRRWQVNGALSEQIEFTNNQPEGVSLAWFPSGSLKARVLVRSGKVVEQQFWKDGERAASSTSPSL